MRYLLLTLLLFSTTSAPAQDATAKRIMEQAQAAKPAPAKLRFYDLDWANSLAHARQRAREEKRPIVFLWITNITAGCNFFTGHT